MAGLMDIIILLVILGGGYWLYSTGQLNQLLSGAKLPTVPGPGQQEFTPPAAPAPAPAPAPSGGGGDEQDEPENAPPPTTPAPSGGGTATGKSIYQVVAPIAGTSDNTIRGGGSSYRANLGYPCTKCAREATWIFKPGTGGDWSVKMGSHGGDGEKTSLIELGNIPTDSSGGKWQCEGPHMTYNDVAGGNGSGPAIGGKPRVGIKGISWPTGPSSIHHEIWYDETGSGNNWKKVADFTGSANGCTPITCPVPSPSGKCQDTLRLDGPSGHQFISASLVEIKAGAAGGGGGGGTGTPVIGSPPTQTTGGSGTPVIGSRPQSGGNGGGQTPVIQDSNYAMRPRRSSYQAGQRGVIMAPVATQPTARPCMFLGKPCSPSQVTPAPATTQPMSTAPPVPTIPGGVSAEPGSIPIRWEQNGNRMWVPVKINGGSMEIKLDTGAVGTLINKTEADRLGISKLTPTGTQGIRSGGASATITKYNVTMQIGAGTPFQTSIGVRAAGAIAPAILARADVEKSGYVAVLTGGNLRLVKRGTSVVTPALITNTKDHRLGMTITINGNPLNITYDTGVTSTILSDKDAALVKLDLSKPTGTKEVTSATGSVRTDPYFTVSMKIGNSPAFQTNVNVMVGRPASTLSGADMIKSGHVGLIGGSPQYVPRGTRIVAPARARFNNIRYI